jgi:hypothetical protein
MLFPARALLLFPTARARLRGDGLKLAFRNQVSRSGHPCLLTVYVKGPRAREEFRLFSGVVSGRSGPIKYYYGPRAARICQCDLRRVYKLGLNARQYAVSELDDRGLPASLKPQPVQPSGATVDVTIESRDTGERKKILGHPARHIVTHEEVVAGPGACTPSEQIDQSGWYADLPTGASCFALFGPYARGAPTPTGECNGKRDSIRTRRHGVVGAGFPLELTTTTKSLLATPGRPPEALDHHPFAGGN